MDDLRSASVPAVRDDDHVRGGGRLVVFYADLTCPRCAVEHQRLQAERARVVFRHLALKARHPRALALAHAAEAAAGQGAFWAFADATYADQGRLEDPHLWDRARELGLDVERFDAHSDIDNPGAHAVLERNGFSREGVLRGWGARGAGRVDAVMFGRLTPPQ